MYTNLDQKIIFSILSIVFSLVTTIPYIFLVLKKKATPHVLTWTTWGILTGIGFVLSLSEGGGGGAAVFGVNSLMCFSLATYAFFKVKKDIKTIDWISFGVSVTIAIIYLFTRNATLSVVLAASIDFLGLLPTIRKSYKKPYSEPALSYLFSVFSFFFSILALEKYSFVTVFYPLSIVITYCGFVFFLILRRKKII